MHYAVYEVILNKHTRVFVITKFINWVYMA